MDRARAIDLSTKLYRALDAWDLPALESLLHRDFRGRTTRGMPLDLGGTYDGPKQMIKSFWAKIGRSFDARAVPERFAFTDDGRLLVQGMYIGRARDESTGETALPDLRAAFVHLLTFDGTQLLELEQLTDSQKWHEALGTAPAGETP